MSAVRTDNVATKKIELNSFKTTYYDHCTVFILGLSLLQCNLHWKIPLSLKYLQRLLQFVVFQFYEQTVISAQGDCSTRFYMKKFKNNGIPTAPGGSARVSRRVTPQEGPTQVGSDSHVNTYCRLTIKGLTL